MLGTFNLMDAIAYLTEGAVRMQMVPCDFVRFRELQVVGPVSGLSLVVFQPAQGRIGDSFDSQLG